MMEIMVVFEVNSFNMRYLKFGLGNKMKIIEKGCINIKYYFFNLVFFNILKCFLSYFKVFKINIFMF